eukprot:CAMPEP_0118886350 /NCGR_PEP_ID=MMETSP1163-20130328/24467_1 /TAXON_ID=124430 /ORGANISM="Phaeomonas parva, Strain CCMP2877" /LENGTH=154 /DNA_ID=CAMNT_0006824539 /DNA_START=84 /DNA_END=548 /DNA_ORIENTATION=-
MILPGGSLLLSRGHTAHAHVTHTHVLPKASWRGNSWPYHVSGARRSPLEVLSHHVRLVHDEEAKECGHEDCPDLALVLRRDNLPNDRGGEAEVQQRRPILKVAPLLAVHAQQQLRNAHPDDHPEPSRALRRRAVDVPVPHRARSPRPGVARGCG